MPLKDEERVGRRVGTKGSQLFRSDKGSNTLNQSHSAVPSKFKIDRSSSHDSLESKYKNFKMPLKDEERVGRRVGTKGSQLFRSDKGSFTFKKAEKVKQSKFQANEENHDSSSIDGSESDK